MSYEQPFRLYGAFIVKLIGRATYVSCYSYKDLSKSWRCLNADWQI